MTMQISFTKVSGKRCWMNLIKYQTVKNEINRNYYFFSYQEKKKI